MNVSVYSAGLRAEGLDILVHSAWVRLAEGLDVFVNASAIHTSALMLTVHATAVVRRVVDQFAVLLSGVAVSPDPTFLVANNLSVSIVDRSTYPTLGAVVLAFVASELKCRVVDLTVLCVEATSNRVDARHLVRRDIDRELTLGKWNETGLRNDNGTAGTWNHDLSRCEVAGCDDDEGDESSWRA